MHSNPGIPVTASHPFWSRYSRWAEPIAKPTCAAHNGRTHCPGKPVAFRSIEGTRYHVCEACAHDVDRGAYGPVDGQLPMPVRRTARVFV